MNIYKFIFFRKDKKKLLKSYSEQGKKILLPITDL